MRMRSRAGTHLQLHSTCAQLAYAAAASLLAHRHAPVLQVANLAPAAARHGHWAATPDNRGHLAEAHKGAADLAPEVVEQIVPLINLQPPPGRESITCPLQVLINPQM
jgi:hypothetical protein